MCVLVLCYRCISAFTALTTFFCFKQKTAYELRISAWSSDVCSSDLGAMKGTARTAPGAVLDDIDQRAAHRPRHRGRKHALAHLDVPGHHRLVRRALGEAQALEAGGRQAHAVVGDDAHEQIGRAHV